MLVACVPLASEDRQTSFITEEVDTAYSVHSAGAAPPWLSISFLTPGLWDYSDDKCSTGG